MCTCSKFRLEFKDGALLDTGRRLLALKGTFKFPIFKGLGRVSLGQVGAQHSMITSEGLMSKPGKNVVQISLAICSKNGFMSILATHRYYIKDDFTLLLIPNFRFSRSRPNAVKAAG